MRRPLGLKTKIGIRTSYFFICSSQTYEIIEHCLTGLKCRGR